MGFSLNCPWLKLYSQDMHTERLEKMPTKRKRRADIHMSEAQRSHTLKELCSDAMRTLPLHCSDTLGQVRQFSLQVAEELS